MAEQVSPFRHLSILLLREAILAHTAEGAHEIFGNVFPLGTGSNAAFFVAFLFVINPSTNIANVSHFKIPPITIYRAAVVLHVIQIIAP